MSRFTVEGSKSAVFIFSLYKSYCTTPSVDAGVSKMLKFLCFYVMGKALTGELFCTWTGLFASLVDGGANSFLQEFTTFVTHFLPENKQEIMSDRKCQK